MRNLPFRLELLAVLVWVAACGSQDETGFGNAGDAGKTLPDDDAGASVDASGGPQGTFGLPDTGAPGAQLDATAPGPTSGPPGGGPDASADAASSNDGAADGNAQATGDANGLGVDSRAAYCAGSGSPVTVGDSVAGRDVCTGAIAEWTFSHALCSCKDATIPGVFVTDSFDSTQGPYQAGQAGAPVGIDHDLSLAGVPNIGGSLTVAGPDGLALAGGSIVQGDLEVNGNLGFAGVGTVARDLWTGGGLEAAGVVTVGRDLHDPTFALAAGIFTVGGATITAPFTIPPPCACDPSQILDVGAIVAQGRQQNDNADIALDPDALDAVVGAVNIVLPCGRFYLKQIAGAGVIHIDVQGRTALFVDGDIATAGVLDVNLGPAGELDVFVTGNFVPTGLSSFGDVSRPAATRIYVAGSKDVLLTGANAFVGNVYAPNANVALTGVSDIYGSIFAGNFTAPGATAIHYDRGVLDAGKECPPPPVQSDAGTASTPDAGSPSGPGPTPDAGSPSGPGSTPDAASPPPPPPPPPRRRVRRAVRATPGRPAWGALAARAGETATAAPRSCAAAGRAASTSRADCKARTTASSRSPPPCGAPRRRCLRRGRWSAWWGSP